MKFEYYLYIIAGVIIILVAIYSLLTHIFPSISFKKEYIEIEVEFPETIFIPELPELGEFTYNRHSKELQNEIVLPFWMNFKFYSKVDLLDFELNFDSDDKKLNLVQIEAYKSLKNYSTDFWQDTLNKILKYYNKYYSDPEDLEDFNLQKTEDLKNSIQLESIIINDSGGIGMRFNCCWDDEHGLGIRIVKNNKIIVGQASEAF